MSDNQKFDIFSINPINLDKQKLLSGLKDSSKQIEEKIKKIEEKNLEQQVQQYGKDKIYPVCQDEFITVPQLNKHIIRSHPAKAFQRTLAKLFCNFCKNICFQKKRNLQNPVFKCNLLFSSLTQEEQCLLLAACQWQDD